MEKLKPSMRLKVKGDTFFLPDPSSSSVYFRNNLVSYRMEGKTIDQWVEKLMPMFNGEHSMEVLTNGLSAPYRDRVYEIAESLYQNGFVRDVSEDLPHQLPEAVLRKYASQIEYLDGFVGSGAYRFQSYRSSNVLAVGSGPFLVSLVSALLESGLPKLHVIVTDSVPTNRERIAEIAAHARQSDPEVEVQEIASPQAANQGWLEVVQPFDSILYVSEEVDIEELRELRKACRVAGKVLLPAFCLQQAGVAGPFVQPDDADGGWESMWRRIHQSALRKDPQQHAFSSTAGAMLSNVLAFRWLKTSSGVTAGPEQNNRFFLLDLESLEGRWHSWLAHPLAAGETTVGVIQDADARLLQNTSSDRANGSLLAFFGQLTSPVTGIFHVWDEEELVQLPLSQCRVQAVDPLSEGPAELLPGIVCMGMTHQDARREAGLCGLESYASRLAVSLVEAIPLQNTATVGRVTGEPVIGNKTAYIGVGAGETFAEGVCRGLQKCLDEELRSRHNLRKPNVFWVPDVKVEDETCRFYLQALTTLRGAPAIGLGEDVSGFPVVWVGTDGCWHGSTGLNMTLALRNSLQQALLKQQNHAAFPPAQGLEVSSVVLLEETPLRLRISPYEETEQPATLQYAMQVLQRNGKPPLIFDLTLEPFMREQLAGVFGVLLREEESR